jgi:hypothetical protein
VVKELVKALGVPSGKAAYESFKAFVKSPKNILEAIKRTRKMKSYGGYVDDFVTPQAELGGSWLQRLRSVPKGGSGSSWQSNMGPGRVPKTHRLKFTPENRGHSIIPGSRGHTPASSPLDLGNLKPSKELLQGTGLY